MFRFRGQRKDSSEWIIGWYHRHWFHEGQKFVHRISIDTQQRHDGFEINPHTLAISTGKLDSNGVEIFASFEIDGVMTTGGDAVSVNGNNYNIKYSPDLASFIAVNVNGKESGKLFHCIDIDNLTIIGKQGGGNE